MKGTKSGPKIRSVYMTCFHIASHSQYIHQIDCQLKMHENDNFELHAWVDHTAVIAGWRLGAVWSFNGLMHHLPSMKENRLSGPGGDLCGEEGSNPDTVA
jgi:hypothetical protein